MSQSAIAAILIIVFGVIMLFFGVSMFGYRGPTLDPFISGLGEYSFFLWLPTVIIGVVLLRRSKKQKKVTPNDL
jgi:membrane protein implicated in regulation of membrane protease activity